MREADHTSPVSGARVSTTGDHTAMPKGRDIGYLLLGIIGIGTSGPVIALSTIPVPTMVMWRNFGGALLMAPFALKAREWRNRDSHSALRLSVLAGFFLAMHFIAFFCAMRWTSVATGTALTAMQPIFTAIYVRMRGGHIPRRAWGGMALAFLSVVMITGVDLHLSLLAFMGDLVAVLGAALAAAYVLTGSKAQEVLKTSTYTTLCYGVCAITCIPIVLVGGFAITDFPSHQWWLVVALILGAQMLGHTMFNLALKRVSPAVVSLIVFFEVPVSALLAFWWLNQRPSTLTLPALVVLLIGCAIFVARSQGNTQSTSAISIESNLEQG